MKTSISYLKPALFDNKVNAKTLKSDIIAGLNVGIIAVPLSLALAIRSGASPAAGLAAAIVSGIIGAFTSGSKYQITGPTAAFVVTALTISAAHGFSGLLAATFLSGIIMILAGLVRAGKLIRFITPAIVSGFTAGIAVTLFVGQLPDFLGINSTASTAFIEKVKYIFSGPRVNLTSIMTGGISFLCLLFLPKKIKKYIPASFAAIIAGLLIFYIFKPDVRTVGSQYGDIKLRFNFIFPLSGLKGNSILKLISPAVDIAFLCIVVSLLSARVGDRLSSESHRSDAELVSQGLINIGCSVFSLLPVSGAVARTGANIKAGARTPIASLFHAVTILLVAVVFLPVLKDIPLPSLAAVLFGACKNMINISELKGFFTKSLTESVIYTLTLVCAVLINLSVAIIAGAAAYFVILAVREGLVIKRGGLKNSAVKWGVTDNKMYIRGFVNYMNVSRLAMFLKIKEMDNIKEINLEGISALDYYAADCIGEFLKKHKDIVKSSEKVRKILSKYI